MKFEKGMNEDLLWEFLHYNIFDYFDNQDGVLIDYSKQTWLDKLRIRIKGGKLKKDVEIIIKIEGKEMPDCWDENE
jgi:hypothetical protein